MTVKKTATGYAILCGPRAPKRCAYCSERGTQLCDFKVDAETGATCDKPMCVGCAKRVAFQTAYCREHAAPPVYPADTADRPAG